MKLGSFSKIFLSILFVFCVLIAEVSPVYGAVTAQDNGVLISGVSTPEIGRFYGEGKYGFEKISVNPEGWDQMLIFRVVNAITLGILKVGELVLWMGGILFDFAIKATVAEIGSKNSFVKQIIDTSVTGLWQIFRDFGNLIIIFSLLYLAIKTIIQGEGFADKRVLGGILLGALLINFSLFFVKLTFDVSNITALSIYDSIGKTEQSTDQQGLSLSSRIVQNFRYDKVYVDAFNEAESAGKDFFDRMSKQVSYAVFGFCILFLTGCILLAACGFLLIRLLTFLLLMITAPIGFVGKFIPFIKSQTSTWWDQLWKQVISLPVFLLMLYIAFLFIQKNLGSIPAIPWGAIFTGNTAEIVKAWNDIAQGLFSFILSLALLVVAIIIPGKIGGAGASMITAGTGRVGGFIGRRTLGYAGRKIANTKALQKLAPNSGMARTALRVGDKLQKSSFDMRNIKVGGKTVGSRLGMGELRGPATTGLKGIDEAKAKKLKDRYDSDMELVGKEYEEKAIIENKKKEDDKKAKRQVRINEQETKVAEAKRNFEKMEARMKRGERGIKIEELDGLEASYKAEEAKLAEIKKETTTLEKGEFVTKAALYSQMLESQRKNAWGRIKMAFTLGSSSRGSSGAQGMINKEIGPDERLINFLIKEAKKQAEASKKGAETG